MAMKSYLNTAKKNLKRNKEGLLAGALVGWGVAEYMIEKNIGIHIIAESQGLVDPVLEALQGGDILVTKVRLAMIFAFAVIGYMIDSLFLPEK